MLKLLTIGITGTLSVNVAENDIDKQEFIERNLTLSADEISPKMEQESRSSCIYGMKDQYEDNDFIAHATKLTLEKERFQPYPGYYVSTGYDIASVDATISKDPFFCGGDIDVDFYYFNLHGRSNVEITLENIPSGKDYDLYLYEVDSGIGYGSAKSGNSNESITKTLSASKYYLKVVSFSGYSNTEEYKLSIKTKEGGYNSYSLSEAQAKFGTDFFWQTDYQSPYTWSYTEFPLESDKQVPYELYRDIGYQYKDSNGEWQYTMFNDAKIYLTDLNTAGEMFSILSAVTTTVNELENKLEGKYYTHEIAYGAVTSTSCSAAVAAFTPFVGIPVCTVVGGINTLLMPDFGSNSEARLRLEKLKAFQSALSNFGVSGDYDEGPLTIHIKFGLKKSIGHTSSLTGATEYVYKKFYEYEFDGLPDTFTERQGRFGGTISKFYNDIILN